MRKGGKFDKERRKMKNVRGKAPKKNDFFPAFHFLETEIAFGSTKVAISTGKKLKSRLGNNVKMSDFAPPPSTEKYSCYANSL